MRGSPVLAILCAFLLFAPAAAAAGHLVITQPSPAESQIAELRDFYVYGIFNGTVDYPGDVLVEVYAGDTATGMPVRVVRSQVDPATGVTNESVIDSTFPGAVRTNGAMVPDLVKAPGGIRYPGNKVVVTPRYYLALVQGGATRDFATSYTGADGKPLADLTAGNYTILVTGLSGACAGETGTRTITLGLTSTVLGTFKPPANLATLVHYGRDRDRHCYLDWFPGYFVDPDNRSVRFESPGRWTPNNAVEVVNDRPGTLLDTAAVANNTLLVYNLNPDSTTIGVELAGILRFGLEDSPNTTFLAYDIGEPSLSWREASTGRIRNMTGRPVPFPAGTLLMPARAEIFAPSPASSDNRYDPNDLATGKTVDPDPAGGILVPSGQEFVIYGTARPIASAVTATGEPCRYTIDRRIASVASIITDERGRRVSATVHDVNLTRLYTPGSPAGFTSLWEFGIEVADLNVPGAYTLALEGRDTSGQSVPGATAVIPVTVTPVHPAGYFRILVLPDGSPVTAGLPALPGMAHAAGIA